MLDLKFRLATGTRSFLKIKKQETKAKRKAGKTEREGEELLSRAFEEE